MSMVVVLAGLVVWLVVGSPANGYGQVEDIRASEQAYYDLVTLLKSQIDLGWTPTAVAAIMGEPDRQGSYYDGPDVVEVWGYRGYEVLIEFRNGLASGWFFRFMP